MRIRRYTPSDCKQLAELFYNTIHKVCARNYDQSQLDAWAAGEVDLEEWNRSFLEHYSFVAVEDGQIVGFGDINKSGYLDRLFVHAEYQHRGIASAICTELEAAVQTDRVFTHSSLTARPFFEGRGYIVLSEELALRCGVELKYFVMEKRLRR